MQAQVEESEGGLSGQGWAGKAGHTFRQGPQHQRSHGGKNWLMLPWGKDFIDFVSGEKINITELLMLPVKEERVLVYKEEKYSLEE